MVHAKKLSLLSAILISINIMLGSGIFINTVILTKQAGSLGAFVYLLVGALIFPLVLAIAQLLHYHHDSGTFYDFGLSISPFFGFLSSWSYFVAKLCSSALGIHVCISFLQQIIPALQILPTLMVDCFVIVLFTLLNLLNLRIGKSIQYSFLGLKLIPILFVIFAGIYLFSGSYFTTGSALWEGVPISIPLVLYAFSGFEASCSLSTHIENAQKNGPRAILISYGIVVASVFLYQLLFYGSLGPSLGLLPKGYLDAFPAFLSRLVGSDVPIKHILESILHIGIASSSLGAAYGIMYSNSWNLYTLAQNNHTFAKKLFTSVNKHHMPYACVLVEGLLALTYILVSQGQQVPLQQVSALGGTIAYTFSSIALLMLTYRKERALKTLPVASLISCLILIGAFVWTVATKGPSTLLLIFLFLILLGSAMFFRKHEPPPSLEIFEEI
jgi:amino acid transporter